MLPAIIYRIEYRPDSCAWFDDSKPWPKSCVQASSLNQSGGFTTLSEFNRLHGIKTFSIGHKKFNPTTRRWE